MNLKRLLVNPKLWIMVTIVVLSGLALMLMESLAPSPVLTPDAMLPTTGTLVDYQWDSASDLPVLAMRVPSSWADPIPLDPNQLLLSPDGQTTTTTDAGSFIVVARDALTLFRRSLSFRTDYEDPQQQLDALITALNRSAAKFSAAQAYTKTSYPAAVVRGFERGNALVIVLLNTGEQGWVYIGMQATESSADYLEQTVLQPLIQSIHTP